MLSSIFCFSSCSSLFERLTCLLLFRIMNRHDSPSCLFTHFRPTYPLPKAYAHGACAHAHTHTYTHNTAPKKPELHRPYLHDNKQTNKQIHKNNNADKRARGSPQFQRFVRLPFARSLRRYAHPAGQASRVYLRVLCQHA